MKIFPICKSSLAWCAVGALALSTAAWADDDSKGHSCDAKMQRMDADRDGKISAAEHEAGAKKMFQKLDADYDGRVTAADMDASHQDMAGARSSKPMKSSADRIRTIDTDSDGTITAQEHEAGSRKMFRKMDKDQDGSLSAAEIRAGHDRMMTAEE